MSSQKQYRTSSTKHNQTIGTKFFSTNTDITIIANKITNTDSLSYYYALSANYYSPQYLSSPTDYSLLQS